MYLDKAKKEEIFGQYGKSNTDTGSAESQIALFADKTCRQASCASELSVRPRCEPLPCDSKGSRFA